MPTALEVELKQYAHNLVADYVKYEYDKQLLKWQDHIDFLVDAQTEALNRHQKVLNEARKQVAEEREAALGFSMLVLSVVAGPALSWVAGKIQYKWFPKLTQKPRERWQAVHDDVLRDSGWYPWKAQRIAEYDHDKVWAKIFGDLGKQVTGWGIDKAIKVVTPSPSAARNAIESAAMADEASFGTRLKHAMRSEAQLTSDAIMSVAMSINENDSYGADCLQKLKLVNPRARDPRVSEKELELMDKQMIREDINARRQEWADKWFYYGNNPGSTAGLSETIEVEMWGMWILNEKLQMKSHKETVYFHGDKESIERKWVEGATFGDKGVPEAVLRRLAEFGVVLGRTRQQRREESLRWEAEHRPPSKPVTFPAPTDPAPKNPAVVSVVDPDEEKRVRDERLHRKVRAVEREIQRIHDLDKTHPSTEDRPVIDVGSAIDTQQEIDALESWAKHHPLRRGAGQLRHSKGTLVSVENITHDG